MSYLIQEHQRWSSELALEKSFMLQSSVPQGLPGTLYYLRSRKADGAKINEKKRTQTS